jgi:hypothetical protein
LPPGAFYSPGCFPSLIPIKNALLRDPGAFGMEVISHGGLLKEIKEPLWLQPNKGEPTRLVHRKEGRFSILKGQFAFVEFLAQDLVIGSTSM